MYIFSTTSECTLARSCCCSCNVRIMYSVILGVMDLNLKLNVKWKISRTRVKGAYACASAIYLMKYNPCCWPPNSLHYKSWCESGHCIHIYGTKKDEARHSRKHETINQHAEITYDIQKDYHQKVNIGYAYIYIYIHTYVGVCIYIYTIYIFTHTSGIFLMFCWPCISVYLS